MNPRVLAAAPDVRVAAANETLCGIAIGVVERSEDAEVAAPEIHRPFRVVEEHILFFKRLVGDAASHLCAQRLPLLHFVGRDHPLAVLVHSLEPECRRILEGSSRRLRDEADLPPVCRSLDPVHLVVIAIHYKRRERAVAWIPSHYEVRVRPDYILS